MAKLVQQTRWSPAAGGIAGYATAGIALAIFAVTSATDPAGRILLGSAGLGLLAFAGVSWRARPKLAITAKGLAVRGWRRTRLFTPAAIAAVRITEFRRIGRRVRLLEIETVDDHLLVLSRWDLGTDPLDVLDALTAAGYTGRRPGPA